MALSHEELRPLLRELPSLLESAAAERIDHARADAGEARKVAEMIDLARRRMAERLSQRNLDQLLDTFADRVRRFNRQQLNKQIRAALGADVFLPSEGLAPVIDAFTVDNSRLIRSIPEQLLGDVEGVINRAIRNASTHREVTKQIQERFRVGRNRARLIARDQVSTLYSQVNQTRQKAIGGTHYIWRTVRDERVRDEHEPLEGRKFSWEKGHPTEGHPGVPVQCRCYAEPVLDFLDE